MKIGTSRMETFSDGVISIIITIMVLAVKLPDLRHNESAPAMHSYIVQVLPYVGTYAFSFLMIGIFWTNHHHMFHLLERTNEALIWQNLLFLFWISLIPIATAMVSANINLSESAAAYSFVLLMTTLSFAVMRTYTLRKGLVHNEKDKQLNSKIYL